MSAFEKCFKAEIFSHYKRFSLIYWILNQNQIEMLETHFSHSNQHVNGLLETIISRSQKIIWKSKKLQLYLSWISFNQFRFDFYDYKIGCCCCSIGNLLLAIRNFVSTLNEVLELKSSEQKKKLYNHSKESFHFKWHILFTFIRFETYF